MTHSYEPDEKKIYLNILTFFFYKFWTTEKGQTKFDNNNK